MRADGEATATVTQDSFSIERLKLSNWPIEMELTTSPATIRGTLRQR